MSLELPCKDLNLTSENAPTTARLVPKLPFTTIITKQTSTGKIINVLAKFFDVFPVFMYVYEITRPKRAAVRE